MVKDTAGVEPCISTHALTWSATYIFLMMISRSCYFNSRAHVERDNGKRYRRRRALHFNSRAHVERDYLFFKLVRMVFYFNSRAHVERDPNLYILKIISVISTHALTWSATVVLSSVTRPVSEFQLTRSRGARQNDDIWDPANWVISTHALTWSATDLAPYDLWEQMISTHALTWSATAGAHPASRDDQFQLTRSRGARPPRLSTPAQHAAFQLTRSRGARRVQPM